MTLTTKTFSTGCSSGKRQFIMPSIKEIIYVGATCQAKEPMNRYSLPIQNSDQ